MAKDTEVTKFLRKCKKGIDTLRKVKELLADPWHWVRYQLACDKYGNSVDPDDPLAAAFCLNGAIHKVATSKKEAMRCRMALQSTLGGSITIFNDVAVTSHEEVIDLIDRTILRLQKEESDGPDEDHVADRGRQGALVGSGGS